MHPLVRLAKDAVEAHVRNRKKVRPPEDLPPEFMQPGAAFICLKKGKNLRGCIGTVAPTRASLAEEVIDNAVNSCSRDPRFDPVDEDELKELSYTVDVLEQAEPVASVKELDPRVYGVIVEKGWRRGLLLPDLEGVDTVEQQIHIARQKAGIAPDETDLKISRFRVSRYK